MVYQYIYDNKGRAIESRVPGAGWNYVVYDELNRPVMTQDENQRQATTKKWNFLKYDIFGRPIIAGEFTLNASRATVQASVEAQTQNFEEETTDATGYTLNKTYPTVSTGDLLSVVYYDNYDFLSYTNWDAESNSYSFVAELNNTDYNSRIKGRVTGGKIKILGGTTWLNSVSYYDKFGRTIQAIAENHLTGLDRMTLEYDLGTVINSLHTHTGGENITQKREYVYDHAGRLIKLYHTLNTDPKQLLATYAYNALGQPIETNLHSTGAQEDNFLQSIDTRYNIRGWLTGINNADLSNGGINDDDTDLFGMAFNYTNNVTVGGSSTTARLDGSPTTLAWSNLGTSADEQVQAFTYDQMGRMTEANYATKVAGVWTGDVDKYTVSGIEYDVNSNIETLERNETATQQLDDLSYTYVNGILDKVEDTGNANGFDNGATQTGEYEYDYNGNVKKDLNKGMSTITYNLFNQPEKITFDDNPFYFT